MERGQIEEAILALVGKQGRGVTDAVDEVLATVEQDEETYEYMNRLGWVFHATTLVSGQRKDKEEGKGKKAKKQRTRRSRVRATLSALARVEYQGADGRTKPLLKFTLADWVRFRSREVSVRDGADAKITLATVAIEALSKSGARTTGALPADALASVSAHADTLFGAAQKVAAA